ncbi:ComF family protein [Patescibacteria group bacterium]|nr:ComF family protein [Patescibacteria group bacterium]
MCQKESIEGETHPYCKKINSPDKLIVFYLYKDSIRNLILRCKYRDKAFKIVHELIEYIFEFKEQFNLHEIDSAFIVTAIPTDVERFKKRRFNFSQIIAKELAKKLNLDYKDFLTKPISTPSLTSYSKAKRKKSVRGVFEIKNTVVPESVLLVDDIITTGSTLIEASRILKKSGCKNVWCLTLCYRPILKQY